jgi:hypothetical protein
MGANCHLPKPGNVPIIVERGGTSVALCGVSWTPDRLEQNEPRLGMVKIGRRVLGYCLNV